MIKILSMLNFNRVLVLSVLNRIQQITCKEDEEGEEDMEETTKSKSVGQESSFLNDWWKLHPVLKALIIITIMIICVAGYIASPFKFRCNRRFSIGFGSYVAGQIPMIFTLSEKRMRLFSIFGAGVLMGAALCVIIPEGVNTIYESTMRREILEAMHHNSSTHHHSGHGGDAHTIVGLTLLLGFVMMLVIDQISSGFSSSHNYSSLPTVTEQSDSVGHNLSSATVQSSSKKSTSLVASIGLIIHSAADGIALGAAATLKTSSRVQEILVIFFAILLHKAPAAFGLVSFLLHEGLDKKQAKKHLLYFSLSAPITALVTFFGISTSTKEALSDVNATGIALLFSAGTFLYVAAVHVLPEITQHQKLKSSELFYMIVASFIPLLLTFNHTH